MQKKYLALGDSYTIGETLVYEKNFPSQLTSVLNQKGQNYKLDKLIAVTGWTTDELALAIEKERPSLDYDLVTLLIGVNNQYRGRSVDEYRWQFYSLLCQSILFAGGKSEQVVVLSIPDWGLTPFNKEKDIKTVSEEIDLYNQINQEIALDMGCKYVYVTGSTRLHAKDTYYLAHDLLHYAEQEYAIWAQKVAELIQ